MATAAGTAERAAPRGTTGCGRGADVGHCGMQRPALGAPFYGGKGAVIGRGGAVVGHAQ